VSLVNTASSKGPCAKKFATVFKIKQISRWRIKDQCYVL